MVRGERVGSVVVTHVIAPVRLPRIELNHCALVREPQRRRRRVGVLELQRRRPIGGLRQPGRTKNAYTGQLQLREQQVIQKTVGADRSFVESFSVRRVDLNTGQLGSTTKISETKCSGTCVPTPPPPPAEAKPAAAPTVETAQN